MQKGKIKEEYRDFLYQKYINEKLTGMEIAKIMDIPMRTVHSWLVKFNIPRRKTGVEYLSEERKKQISQWNKSHPEIIRMKGKKHSKETKKLMSKLRSGCKNSNWKGGITLIKRGIRHSKEYAQWRRVVLKRDGNICRNCSKPNSRHAHHVKPFKEYPESMFNLENGLTMCNECHKKIHFEGGVLFNVQI